MFLLDTNVISELVRLAPNPAVVTFVRGIRPDELLTSTVCEAELRFGLARLPAGLRRAELAKKIDMLLATSFRFSILPFDRLCAAMYGKVRADCTEKGNQIKSADAMIAATACVHGAALVTRNVRDFAYCGLTIIDPWLTPPP